MFIYELGKVISPRKDYVQENELGLLHRHPNIEQFG